MVNFQVMATLDNGATVMFGVDADDEDAALLAANKWLNSCLPKKAEHVQLIELTRRRAG